MVLYSQNNFSVLRFKDIHIGIFFMLPQADDKIVRIIARLLIGTADGMKIVERYRAANIR